MTHSLSLDHKYFIQVYNGEKDYEMCLYDEQRQYYEDNDIIVVNEKETCRFYTAIITRVQYFEYINKPLEVYGFQNFLPDAKDLTDAIETYEKFPRYTEKGRELGVLIFKITRISDISE